MRADVLDIFHGDLFLSDVHKSPSLANDLAQVKGSGIKGIFHKATQGVLAHDGLYAPRRRAIEDAGLMHGAYDFNTGDPVKQQVDYFFSVAEPGPRTACALDFEDNRASNMTLGQACDYLDLADARLGRRFWLYSGNRLKTLIVHATEEQRAFLSLHILWGCEYGSLFRMTDDNRRPLPWRQGVGLWQFTGDGIGPLPHSVPGVATKGVDLNQWSDELGPLELAWPGAPLSGAAKPDATPPPPAPSPIPATPAPAAPAPKPAPAFSVVRNPDHEPVVDTPKPSPPDRQGGGDS